MAGNDGVEDIRADGREIVVNDEPIEQRNELHICEELKKYLKDMYSEANFKAPVF